MPTTAFDHYTLRVSDIDASIDFYCRVMGMTVQKLDSFEFPFAMLSVGGQAVVHMLGAGKALDGFLGRHAPAYAEGVERKTGNMEHVAFNAVGYADFVATLDREKIRYVARTLDAYGVRQLLFDDPDGVEIEVNFPLVEP